MKISEKLYNLRTAHGLSMVEFGRIAGASDVSINFWERGLRSPKVRYLRNICDRYGIDLATFLDESNDIYDGTRPENIIPLPSMRRVPLIGTIACGQPILAVEDASETIPMPDDIHADFALRCKGDSMINARIFDGDIVYIRSQPDVENGEIAAVIIDDEATLKRVYHHPDSIVLQPENPLFQPIVLHGADMETVRIIGKAVAFLSTVR